MMKSKIRFTEDMQFIGTADSGHAVVMDAPLSVGGKNTGSKPSELLLMAFGGCTGMDVVSILRKKKQDVTGFEMNVSGETPEKYPKSFTEIHIEYVVRGKNISEEAVKHAIELSMEKYCLVGATIGKAAKITHSHKVIQES
ncbi:MAG TPA: osmotically inducible protein OsmC [candidate division Zixibacteria bacterium]|nr:osmotically inducible protein OsmC [candidate division Zixibacteria bacterium]